MYIIVYKSHIFFRDTFVIFDKDGDGTIDSKELSTVLRAMGYNPSKVREDVEQLVVVYDDTNNDDIMILVMMNRRR